MLMFVQKEIMNEDVKVEGVLTPPSAVDNMGLM